MILKKEDQEKTKPVIDLTGTDGNSFVLISYARRWSRDLGLDYDSIKDDMTSGDYEHLLEVIEKHFGEYIIMLR